ncbi:MAG: hypothetical protein K8F25_06935, partial [Fimbriimonadaceae bacterium]|nr:hypothetical protein [Alphaproteobacteria bacterium]
MSETEFSWYPSEPLIANSNLKAFIDAAGLADFDALQARADTDPEWFWNSAIQFIGTRFFKPYSVVKSNPADIAWTE